MTRKFIVDWDDLDHPQIVDARLVTENDLRPVRSFLECKREIVEHFQNEVDFAQGKIRDTRALRMRDVETSSGGGI